MVQRILDGLASHKMEIVIALVVIFVLGLIGWHGMSSAWDRTIRDDENDRMR